MYVRTGIPAFDELIPRINRFLEQDLLELSIDGERIRGYRSPDARSVRITSYNVCYTKLLRGTGSRGPITQRIQQLYFDAVRGKAAGHADWLAMV